MHDPIEWSRLDAAAFRVSMMRSVRWLGWILAGVGLLLVVIGILAPFSPFVIMGPVLACAGLWNILRPSVGGLLVDGLAVMLTGAFHLLAPVWMEDARAASLGKAAITGLFQVIWGFQRLSLFSTARKSQDDQVAIARLQAMVQQLARGDVKSDASIVEFRTGRFNLQRNRLGLLAEGAIGLLEQQAVRLEKRTDIWIEARGTTSLGRAVKVEVQMSDLRLAGEMPADHLERFERWKVGMSQATSSAA